MASPYYQAPGAEQGRPEDSRSSFMSEVPGSHASNVSLIREEEFISVKLGEAKNLPNRSHSSSSSRDISVGISLDQEEIFRSARTQKCSNPFFGEEFYFEVPRRFQCLSFYVYEQDKSSKQEKIIGKVAIKHENLVNYGGKDHWFPINAVDADSEVQGKIHVEARLSSLISKNFNGLHDSLAVKIIECSDLAIVNGTCEPFITVTVVHGSGKQEVKRTRVKKKTTSPKYDELFYFEMLKHDVPTDRSLSLYSFNSKDCMLVRNGEIKITVWHESSGISGPVFLGEVRLFLKDIDLMSGHSAWYKLQPRETIKSCKQDLGTLRLNINHVIHHIFSSQQYDCLRKLLLDSPMIKPVTSSAVYIIGELVSNKVDIAQPLVRIFLHHDQIIPLMKSLASYEISKTTNPTTIFRGNTLVSKCMDELMKLVGSTYLLTTLRPSIEFIFLDNKCCEIDPSRIPEGESNQTNLANLKGYVVHIFQAITASAVRCPLLMCQVFSELAHLATTHFPGNKEVRYSVVSGFIFLRFFAPAILGPKLFGLTTEKIDPQLNRTLTLISKTIQSLGNLVSSKSIYHCKEDYMSPIHEEFATENRIAAVRAFLDLLSTIPLAGSRQSQPPLMLKEGVLIKRAQGRKKIGIKNFKKRYFCLTTLDLSYSKKKGSPPLCKIPLEDILAVEILQEDSFQMKNMFQVVQPSRALYIQANNCVEMKEWLDTLTQICQFNSRRLQNYHPSAFLHGSWSCCKSDSELSPGCRAVSQGMDPNLQLQVDSDKEMERIYSLLVNNVELLNGSLEKLKNKYENEAEMESFYSCFNSLINSIRQLSEHHNTYLAAVASQAQYGSKQAPIGDDNHLQLAARVTKVTVQPLKKCLSDPSS